MGTKIMRFSSARPPAARISAAIITFTPRSRLRTYEAAELDGLNYFGIYRKIVLPLIMPALCAIAIFTFNWAWGDVMGPLIYLQDSAKMTLALGVANMSASTNPLGAMNMSVVMSLSVLMTIPQIVIYFVGQKYLFQLNLGIGNSGTK